MPVLIKISANNCRDAVVFHQWLTYNRQEEEEEEGGGAVLVERPESITSA